MQPMVIDKQDVMTQRALVRQFTTGATRDTDEGKLDFEGFLSPLVLERYAQFMHKNRFQSDGKLRDADNWQKGIPLTAYMKSGWRHFFAWWKGHRACDFALVGNYPNVEDEVCALIFNASGYLHEILKAKKEAKCVSAST